MVAPGFGGAFAPGLDSTVRFPIVLFSRYDWRMVRNGAALGMSYWRWPVIITGGKPVFGSRMRIHHRVSGGAGMVIFSRWRRRHGGYETLPKRTRIIIRAAVGTGMGIGNQMWYYGAIFRRRLRRARGVLLISRSGPLTFRCFRKVGSEDIKPLAASGAVPAPASAISGNVANWRNQRHCV